MKPSTVQNILSSRRQSTNALYDVRWKVWFEYCQVHKIDPIHPSVTQFTDFLQFLFEVKKLSPTTVADYKSAIALTISLTRGVHHLHFANSILVTLLLDGMKRSFASTLKTCPAWDIRIVLTFFRDVYDSLDKLCCVY